MSLEAKKFVPSSGTTALVFALMGLGAATFAAGLFTDPARVWRAYLVYHLMAFGFSVGGLFFLVIHYLAGAGWNVAVRRVTESFASYFFFAVLLTAVLLLGIKQIYPWSQEEYLAHAHHIFPGKRTYYSTAFFVARVAFFFVVIGLIARQLLANSTRQDESGAVELLQKQKPLSAIFLVLFAPLFTVLSVDLVKSLDPVWFSTMFGVYVFVGFVQATAAAVILTVITLQKHGYLKEVTSDHFHDMAKYLFGFSIFWAYIGVSQYLLIWYANLPEEITFYMNRQVPGWVGWSILLPVVRFVIPFLLLLPRMAKRTPAYLSKVCYVVLFGAWLDLYWMVMPGLSPNGFGFSVWDVGLGLGFLGVFLFAVRRFLSRHNTMPVKDPYLHETLHHHVY